MERPLLGWGASTFPILFNTRYSEFPREPTHPHNLILEIANSYGLIFSISDLIDCSRSNIFLLNNI